LFAVALAIIAGVLATIRHTTQLSEETLTARSEASTEIWVRHFSSQIGGFKGIIEAGQASPEQIAMLNEAQYFVDVFRFKVFDNTGRLILLSDNVSSFDANFLVDDEPNDNALEVLRTRNQVTEINDGREKSNRPDWYAESYLPLLDGDDVVGVTEVYVDVSQARSNSGGIPKPVKNPKLTSCCCRPLYL